MVRVLRINRPIMHTFLHHDVVPDKILYNGSKIMYMHVAKELDLTFLDSLNFLGMRLSKLPGCFDLNELCKGYFPHLFNTSENQHYVGPYPNIFGKSPIGMVPSEGYTARDNFSMSSIQWLKWTMAKKNGEEEETCPHKTCIERR